MKKNHIKAIKGLAIASIVVSALCILTMVVALIAVAVVGPLAIDAAGYAVYDGVDDIEDLLYGYGYGYGHGYGGSGYGSPYGYSSADSAVIAAALGAVMFVFVFGALLNVACLIGAIIVLRSADDPSQYGKVFGWGIAGAICGLFGSGGVLTVLFVLIAVFAGMDRKLYAQGAFCDENGYFYMPVGQQAPVTPGAGPVYAAPMPDGRPVPEPVTAAQGQVVTTVVSNPAPAAEQVQPVQVEGQVQAMEAQQAIEAVQPVVVSQPDPVQPMEESQGQPPIRVVGVKVQDESGEMRSVPFEEVNGVVTWSSEPEDRQ